jgi:thioredoxin-dependent peroxiredoxin
MKTMVFIVLVSFLLCLASVRGAESGKSTVQAGDQAPDFQLPGSDGKTYTLKQFAGKKTVLMAWFPKAFTGG